MIVTAEKTRDRKVSLQIKSTKTSSSQATVMTLEMAKFFCWCRWSRNWHWMLVWLRARDHRRETTSCAARTVLLQHYRMPLLLMSLQGCRTVGVSMIVALTLNVGPYGYWGGNIWLGGGNHRRKPLPFSLNRSSPKHITPPPLHNLCSDRLEILFKKWKSGQIHSNDR